MQISLADNSAYTYTNYKLDAHFDLAYYPYIYFRVIFLFQVIILKRFTTSKSDRI